MPTTIYELVGGRDFFEALVDAFYRGVEADGILRPLYPDDLEGPRERLTAFLVQYFGGPTEYAALRGEPRLRFRHLEFAIDTRARDAWVANMEAALDELAPSEAVRSELSDYFATAATFFINRGLTFAPGRGDPGR